MSIRKYIIGLALATVGLFGMPLLVYATELPIHQWNESEEIIQLVNKFHMTDMNEMNTLDNAFANSELSDDFHVYLNGIELEGFSPNVPGHYIHIPAKYYSSDFPIPTISFASGQGLTCVLADASELFGPDYFPPTTGFWCHQGNSGHYTYQFFDQNNNIVASYQFAMYQLYTYKCANPIYEDCGYVLDRLDLPTDNYDPTLWFVDDSLVYEPTMKRSLLYGVSNNTESNGLFDNIKPGIYKIAMSPGQLLNADIMWSKLITQENKDQVIELHPSKSVKIGFSNQNNVRDESLPIGTTVADKVTVQAKFDNGTVKNIDFDYLRYNGVPGTDVEDDLGFDALDTQTQVIDGFGDQPNAKTMELVFPENIPNGLNFTIIQSIKQSADEFTTADNNWGINQNKTRSDDALSYLDIKLEEGMVLSTDSRAIIVEEVNTASPQSTDTSVNANVTNTEILTNATVSSNDKISPTGDNVIVFPLITVLALITLLGIRLRH